MLKNRGFNLNDKSGFTLIEILAVVVIIMALAALISAAVLAAKRKAQKAARDQDKQTIAAAAMAYRHEYGRWPTASRPANENDDIYIQHAEFLQHLTDRSDAAYNPRNVHFLNLSDYIIDDDSGEILDRVNLEPYPIIVNFASDKLWLSNGSTNWR